MKEQAPKAEYNGEGKDLKRKHSSSSVEDGGADKNKTQPAGGLEEGGKLLGGSAPWPRRDSTPPCAAL